MTYSQPEPPATPPASIPELMDRVALLAGMTLGELAQAAHIAVPQNFKKEKGWTGQLIELWLGADAGSRPEQDFVALGTELKTLPVSTQGKVLETTYVCYAHLTGNQGLNWQDSNVCNKLRQVLWLPIVGERTVAPSDRLVGTGFLWQPTAHEENLLRQDWEEHMDNITLGNIDSLSARHGEVLQLRPKAANGSVVTQAVGQEGNAIQTRPRGFYLRKQFTQAILDSHFS
ncbi:DNA mismatch repair endonuclease MutH [Planctobacterium marinum]|uniref:DNA mismatch repair endonuclease MutH n=1 Tax=Planctobacterium marinum TaxID=1631968 RepID=UPI001E32A4EA|nr:DNA mismatch repair endonuclease MutH [Planctobacterium marinum]MCC2605281.1 DNA mismatch repair endonuclease MutH [Planctobacterium marinum]